MTTSTTLAFVNKKNIRNANRAELVCKAYPSNWGGHYGKSPYDSRVNLSAKKMEERGFILTEITKAEMKRLQGLEAKRAARLQAKSDALELDKRAEAVALCLASEPISMVANVGGNPMVRSVVDLAGTPMIEAYHGCGSGTAYLLNNTLIAYHYGHRQPANAPTMDGVSVVRCELSCTQVCLSNIIA